MLYFSMPCRIHPNGLCPLAGQPRTSCDQSYVIYQATVVKSKRIYIGRTKRRFLDRYNEYKRFLESGVYNHNALTQEAGRCGIKHIETIKFTIIDSTIPGNDSQLCSRESDHINNLLATNPTKCLNIQHSARC